jgi:glucan phosphoethanolaminetransferase (alkaline phosphatase superfamily)
MDSLNDLKQVWLTASVKALPDAPGMVRSIKRYRAKKLAVTLWLLLFVVVLLATMIWVLIDYKSTLVSTRIGEAFMLIALMMMLLVAIKRLRRASAFKDYSNQSFLQYLKQEQVAFFAFQNSTQRIGFAIASAGLLLYIYEGVSRQTMYLLIGYSWCVGWICLVWFILRPIAVRRKTKKLGNRIAELEKIAHQLSGD